MSNVTAADEAILMQTATQKGHPKGLGVLFATEMWERFNFYGMRAILSLFIAEALLMGEKQASLIYGGFLGLCYLTPMLGGYISDKYLGNRNCIMLGGALMGLGQLMLFFSASTFGSSMSAATTLMWAALGVIVFGNGFFKPNISSMVGQLYPKEQKTKLDSAFTIFYMGINVGAFLGITICPLLGDVKHDGVRDLSAFKWGFLAASAAMFLGTILFAFLKNKYVVTPSGEAIGARPDRNAVYEGESTQAKFTSGAIGMAALIFAALVAFFYFIGGQNIIYSIIYGAGISLAVLIMTDATITKVERQRILVLYIIAFFVIFFWAAFEQAGSSLTFIADKQTDTHILGWEMPPSMIQNFNSFFVIILAIPMSLLWTALASRRAEPISPVKQAIGLALIALGYFIIATQVKGLGTAGKIGIIWMIILYFLHTVGELCLSPIGLSLVAKLAPKRFASLLMGVWFLGNAAGYALTGTLGALLPPTGDKYAEAATKGIDLGAVLDKKVTLTPEQTAFLADKKIPTAYTEFAGFTIHNLYEFFMVFVILCGVAAVVLYALTPLLKRMMHGVR
ncbi:peptide MFS transporter [Flaviaesturariibacter flavus]|nr:peptide MFS transporter [Flaviaesturariibacter flavus]